MKNLSIICPGCNAYYRASDYSEKKIKCSRCGREIGKESYLEIKDEKEEVKNFLNSHEYERISGTVSEGKFGKLIPILVFFIPSIVGIWYRLSHNQGITWWLILFLILPFWLLSQFKKGDKEARKFRDYIIRNDYDISRMSEDISGLDEESIIYKGGNASQIDHPRPI